MKHQAQVPAAVAEYARQCGYETDGYEAHPLVASIFTPGRGWKRYPINKRVNPTWARKAKAQGVEAVMVKFANGRVADFRISELVAR